MSEITFDLKGTSKKSETKVTNILFDSQKDVIKSSLTTVIAQIKAAGAQAIMANKSNTELIQSIQDQMKDKIDEETAKSNILLAQLCAKHNKVAETLESSEQIGVYVAKKIQSVKDTKIGRLTRGFIKGIKDGWDK